jgi:hypothetical protein
VENGMQMSSFKKSAYVLSIFQTKPSFTNLFGKSQLDFSATSVQISAVSEKLFKKRFSCKSNFLRKKDSRVKRRTSVAGRFLELDQAWM